MWKQYENLIQNKVSSNMSEQFSEKQVRQIYCSSKESSENSVDKVEFFLEVKPSTRENGSRYAEMPVVRKQE